MVFYIKMELYYCLVNMTSLLLGKVIVILLKWKRMANLVLLTAMGSGYWNAVITGQSSKIMALPN